MRSEFSYESLLAKIGVIQWTIVILVFFTVSNAIAIESKVFDLEQQLKGLDYGNKFENDWREPTDSELTQFAQGFQYFVSGQYDAAHATVQPLGFEVISVVSSDGADQKTYFLMRETNGLGDVSFHGGGTYVVYPSGSNVAISAPHPESDLNTEKQAIETFLDLDTQYLFLPGLRRDNHVHYSPCTNGSYRKSDVAHYHKTYFYKANEVLAAWDEATQFVEFHGFGSGTLGTLQTQCRTTSPLLINISEGVKYDSTSNHHTLMYHFDKEVSDAGIIESCVYGVDTRSYGATWGTTGRMLNNSPDVCTTNATSSTSRFLHVEQSYSVRSLYQIEIRDYLARAIDAFFTLDSGKGTGKKKERKKR